MIVSLALSLQTKDYKIGICHISIKLTVSIKDLTGTTGWNGIELISPSGATAFSFRERFNWFKLFGKLHYTVRTD